MKNGFKKIRFAIKIFLLLFLSVTAVLFVIFITAENYTIKNHINGIKIEELSFLEKNSMFFCSYYSRALSDISYIKKVIEETNDISLEKLQVLLESNRIYKSLRYIDAAGNEIVKGIYSNKKYIQIDRSDMVNVSESPYYNDFFQISDDDIFVSDIFFDEEKTPSMIYMAKVEYRGLHGMIVLDLDVEAMMNEFSKQLGDKSGIYLVGKSGFWSSDEMLFAGLNTDYYKLVYSVGILPSVQWEQIKKYNYIVTEEGMYVFYEIDHSQNIPLFDENIVFEDPVYQLIFLSPKGNGNDYYLYSTFSRKILNVIENRYPYFIIEFLICAVIVAFIILNKTRFEMMKNSSHFDPLTKAYSRNQGITLLEESISKIDIYKTICVCYADINGLKQVNDTLGHNVGDELIKTVTNTVHNMIREDDVMIRMGGDEFIIVFNKVGKAIAETIWSRIVTALKAINSMEDRNYLISVSHGIVEVQSGSKSINIDTIVTEADTKMYEEKLRIKKIFSSISRK